MFTGNRTFFCSQVSLKSYIIWGNLLCLHYMKGAMVTNIAQIEFKCAFPSLFQACQRQSPPIKYHVHHHHQTIFELERNSDKVNKITFSHSYLRYQNISSSSSFLQCPQHDNVLERDRLLLVRNYHARQTDKKRDW